MSIGVDIVPVCWGETSWLCRDFVSLVSHPLGFSSCLLPAQPLLTQPGLGSQWTAILHSLGSLQDGLCWEYSQPLPLQKPQESRVLYWLEGWPASQLWEWMHGLLQPSPEELTLAFHPFTVTKSQALPWESLGGSHSLEPKCISFVDWPERFILLGLIQEHCLPISNPRSTSKFSVPWDSYHGNSYCHLHPPS